VETVIVDAADEHLAGDQFPGVSVVRQIRTYQGDRRPNVVIVTGHFDNDGLRQCMAEVGADFFFMRSDLRKAEDLIDIVLSPSNYRRGVPPISDKAGARKFGITPRSRMSDLVSYVAQHGLEADLNPTGPARDDARSRRWLRHRQAMADLSHLEPINLTTGQPPRRNQHTPSWTQFAQALRWASKVDQSGDGR
jgi:hypothetical protein